MARRPLNGSPSITQVWGEPSSLYRLGYHTGVDYGVGNGTAILAPSNGTIAQVGDGRAQSDGRGFFMIINGDDGIQHNLYHLARWHRSSGRVAEGEHVADSDNTGLSSGPHLHWETRRTPYGAVNNFNPADWLYAVPPAPAPPPAPKEPTMQAYQRLLINKDGVNQRTEPNTKAPVIKDWPYEEGGNNVYSFKAYVRGEDPYGKGNNIWFVGRTSGGYLYSGAFEGGPNTTGLPDQTPAPAPIPAPTPAPVEPTPTPQPDMPVDFKPDDATVIAVHASPDVDELLTQIPKFVVIHHWGDKSVGITRQSVINTMTEDNGLSVHYVVDDSGVYQIVPENKRAQHAGPIGNDGLGIECDPNGSDAMYKHLRLLVANIRVRWGRLELRKHSDIDPVNMPTRCPDHIEILRIEPISVPPNTEVNYDAENNSLLKQILALVQGLVDSFKRIFK